MGSSQGGQQPQQGRVLHGRLHPGAPGRCTAAQLAPATAQPPWMWTSFPKRAHRICAFRVAAVTERCDWPKEAGSRSKAVRCMADCTQLCPGTAQQPGMPASSSTAVVDVELLARESPGLVLAQESSHCCSADAQHVAEVGSFMTAAPQPVNNFQQSQ